MYELEIHRSFSAAHAIVMGGAREPLHGHDWRVDVVVEASELDSDGLVCDFHALEQSLAAVLAPFQSRNLNETPPFDQVNPTAELVARHIAVEMKSRVGARARLKSVRVTEAPGCAARCICQEGTPC
jgi:6-pyruvoyltetrahydropterin/6-carboxytetrahydropterin synthase